MMDLASKLLIWGILARSILNTVCKLDSTTLLMSEYFVFIMLYYYNFLFLGIILLQGKEMRK